MYYDIKPQEFIIDEQLDTEEGHVEFHLTAITECDECPYCYSENFNVHGTMEKRARDLSSFGRQVGLVIKVKRYKCKECGKTFSPVLATIDENARMTKRMKKYVQQQALVKPFLQIEEELSLSDTTIKRVFTEYISELESKREMKAPRVLGIDENHFRKQNHAVFTDIEKRLILDILPRRNKADVKRWLSNLPEKQNVMCVTIDMWEQYKIAVQEELPDATIVVDRFHIIEGINKALDSTRVQMRNNLPKNERRHLKNKRFYFLYGKEKLGKEEQAELEELFKYYPQFKEPYQLKEDFRDLYNAQDRFVAEDMLYDWLERAEKYPQFDPVVTYVNNWFNFILNYFDMPYTNGVTEMLNGKINRVYDAGRGYSFDILRAKLLFGTEATKPAKFKYITHVPQHQGIGFAIPAYEEKIMLRGWGVDIDELCRIIDDDEFVI